MQRALLQRALVSLAPLAVAAGTACCLVYFGWGQLARASSPARALSASLLALALVAALVPRRWVRVHVALAAVPLVVLAYLALGRALGRWPFVWDALPDARYAALIAALAAATAAGLLRDALWGRWAALALGGGAALGGALNSLGQLGRRDEPAWLAAMSLAAGALMLSQLLRPELVRRADAARGAELWATRDRLVSLARAAVICAVAAAAMLVLYALGQPVAPATAPWALALAPVVALGALLVLWRRAVGLLVLGLAGLALAALTIVTIVRAPAATRPIAGYYACFWGPASVTGAAAAALALARARRARLR